MRLRRSIIIFVLATAACTDKGASAGADSGASASADALKFDSLALTGAEKARMISVP